MRSTKQVVQDNYVGDESIYTNALARAALFKGTNWDNSIGRQIDEYWHSATNNMRAKRKKEKILRILKQKKRVQLTIQF